MFMMPFQYRRPITDERFLYGRKDIIKKIVEIAKNSKKIKQDVAIIGQRRIGKTSILYIAEKKIKGFVVPIIINCEETYSFEEKDFFDMLVEKVVEAYSQTNREVIEIFQKALKDFVSNIKELLAVEVSLVDYLTLKFKLQKKEATMREIAESAFKVIESLAKKSEKPFLIVIDEFQNLEKIGGKELFSFLRAKIQKSNALWFVTGSSSMYRITSETKSPFFGLFEIIKVAGIDKKSAVRMIEEQAKIARIVFEKKAVEAILRITSNHPFYINWVCKGCWELTKLENKKIVKENDANKGFEYAMDNLDEHLKYMYSRLPAKEKKVLTVMALFDLNRGKEIAEKMKENTASIISTLSKLLEKEYLVRIEKGKYALADKFLCGWIKRKIEIVL